MTARYAVYWTPEPDHPLWPAGCRWLGRAADGGPGAPQPGRHTPWRYGFHATLKAPMALAEGSGLDDVVDALRVIAAATAPFEIPSLRVSTLAGFVALRPAQAPAPLQQLADRCVGELDPLRSPMAAAELERRSAGLDDDQRERLRRWGYPHVFERWRFHVTLSDPLVAAADREALCRAAEAHFREALAVPVVARSVCIAEEPAAGVPLRLAARLPLLGAAA